MKTCPTCGESFEDAGAAFCPQDATVLLNDTYGGRVDRRVGTVIAGYTLAEVIADGGMGRVYKAFDAESREPRAIKVLHQKVGLDPVSVERFRREYESSVELDHPYLVSAFDFGPTSDGSHYLLMEFLDGEPLSEYLAREGQMPLGRVLRYAAQLSVALGHTHAAGLVHRDLKPENIFLRETSAGIDVCLLDFGSAKNQMEMGERLTAIGTTLGSPAYMSPEQASGERDIDQRTDIFALGAILHEMLSAEVAFGGSSMADILNRVVRVDYRPLQNVESSVSAAIATAMRLRKEERPQTAEAYIERVMQASGVDVSIKELAELSVQEVDLVLASRVMPLMTAPTEYPPVESQPEAASENPVDLGVPIVPQQTRNWGVWAIVGIGVVAGLIYALI